MGVVQLRQIRNRLVQAFVPQLDMTDYVGRPEPVKESAALSRALAAFALSSEADLDPSIACGAVVDGFDDNGIDAIYFSRADQTLYVLQSKWSNDGTGSLDLAAVHKFTHGITDLLALRFANFNQRVNRRKVELDLDITNASRVVAIVTYSGSDTIGDHPRRHLDDFISQMNDTGEVAFLRVMNQESLYRIVVEGGRGEPIDISVQLFEWGQTRTPYQAFYGQVAASDVADWGARFRQRIFSKNIRGFLGPSTTVNDSIAESIKANPSHFWYFNNGVTVLCGSIRRRPIGGASRDVGTFDCTDVAVVNGAQTVGVLTELERTNAENVALARVPIRLISLEDCPPEFGMEVTRATNTQNRVDSRNFVALDPEQDRLRNELLVDGIEYEFRQGEGEPVGKDRFGLVEATVALACSQAEVDLAVQAKREISKLWDDLGRRPYKRMFNATLTGLRLWNLVQTIRIIEKALEEQRVAAGPSKRKNMITHGNRLLAHAVMRRIDLSVAGQPTFDITRVETAIREVVPKLVDNLQSEIDKNYAESYLASLFKNATKCREITTCL